MFLSFYFLGIYYSQEKWKLWPLYSILPGVFLQLLSNILLWNFSNIHQNWKTFTVNALLYPSPRLYIIMLPIHPSILQKFLTLVVSFIIFKWINILQLQFFYNFLALLLRFPCTSVHFSHCILIICLDACLPFRVIITPKTAFISLYIGTSPHHTLGKSRSLIPIYLSYLLCLLPCILISLTSFITFLYRVSLPWELFYC